MMRAPGAFLATWPTKKKTLTNIVTSHSPTSQESTRINKEGPSNHQQVDPPNCNWHRASRFSWPRHFSIFFVSCASCLQSAQDSAVTWAAQLQKTPARLALGQNPSLPGRVGRPGPQKRSQLARFLTCFSDPQPHPPAGESSWASRTVGLQVFLEDLPSFSVDNASIGPAPPPVWLRIQKPSHDSASSDFNPKINFTNKRFLGSTASLPNLYPYGHSLHSREAARKKQSPRH